jgi:SAM-dependent methyltransferase
MGGEATPANLTASASKGSQQMSAAAICPVCHSADTATVNELTASQTAGYFCSPSRDAIRHQRLATSIRTLWSGEQGYIKRCRDCGFGFGDPYVGGDEDFYSILHEQHGYPSWRWDYDVALAHAPAVGKALDIGAGRGFFLKGLPAGWIAHAVESTQAMRAHLKADRINVFGGLDDAPSATFDLVTMFQVLEHIADFRGTIAECHRVLKPGGLLVITVPDCDAMLAQERLTGAPDLPPNHVAKWTPATLQRVLKDEGFDVETTIPEPPSWKKIGSMMHLKVMSDALRPGTLAARAYSIKDRRLRVPLLALVGLLTSTPMIPEWKALRAGGAFGTVARKRG